MKSRVHSRPVSGEMAGCCCKSSSAILTTPAIKSGHLHLVVKSKGLNHNGQNTNCNLRVPVNVKIYNNGFDHYAVVQKDGKKYGNGSVYINLRNCRVLRADTDKNTFYVSSTVSEGNNLVFQTESLEDLKDWLSACKGQNSTRKSSCHMAPNLSPSIPRSSLLPTLTEETEEE